MTLLTKLSQSDVTYLQDKGIDTIPLVKKIILEKLQWMFKNESIYKNKVVRAQWDPAKDGTSKLSAIVDNGATLDSTNVEQDIVSTDTSVTLTVNQRKLLMRDISDPETWVANAISAKVRRMQAGIE